MDHYFSQILSSFIITYLIFKFLLLLTFYFNRRNIWDNFAIFIFNIFSFFVLHEVIEAFAINFRTLKYWNVRIRIKRRFMNSYYEERLKNLFHPLS